MSTRVVCGHRVTSKGSDSKDGGLRSEQVRRRMCDGLIALNAEERLWRGEDRGDTGADEPLDVDLPCGGGELWSCVWDFCAAASRLCHCAAVAVHRFAAGVFEAAYRGIIHAGENRRGGCEQKENRGDGEDAAHDD